MQTRHETFKGPRGEEIILDVDAVLRTFVNFICEEQHEKDMGWTLTAAWYQEWHDAAARTIVAVKRGQG